jgi:hypothetical protein
MTYFFKLKLDYLLHMSASSSITTRTSSSGSTTPGPGALSGKVILALGKLTLRGADYLIIRRRLHVISSNFPHSNETNIKGLEQMYDDILELSRSVNCAFCLDDDSFIEAYQAWPVSRHGQNTDYSLDPCTDCQ